MNKKQIDWILKVLKSQKLVKSYDISIGKPSFETLLKHGLNEKTKIYNIDFIDYKGNELNFTMNNIYEINLKEILYRMILSFKPTKNASQTI